MSRTRKIYNDIKSKLLVHKWWKEHHVCMGPHNECRRCHERRHPKEFRGYGWARKKDLLKHGGDE